MDDWADGLGWSHSEENLYADLAGSHGGMLDDSFAQTLFDLGYFAPDLSYDERIIAQDYLNEWLENEYGLDFEESFDWEAYREAYAAG